MRDRAGVACVVRSRSRWLGLGLTLARGKAACACVRACGDDNQRSCTRDTKAKAPHKSEQTAIARRKTVPIRDTRVSVVAWSEA